MVNPILNMKAKKQFGQNFLIDNTVLDKISNSVFASEEDLIIEIGPGRGALTKKLLEKKAKILAYEIDRDLIPVLNKLDNKNLIIKNVDFLKSDISEDLKDFDYKNLFIVGNLPYYITTPIIDNIIKSGVFHESLTIMVQFEVANRFLASVKSKDYGYFTVFLQHFYNLKRIIDVNATSFDPAPKVKSSVIQLTLKSDIINMEDEYFEFLKECFKEKRKTLKNNLKNYNPETIVNILKNNNLHELARAEECSEKVFLEIYEKCIKIK